MSFTKGRFDAAALLPPLVPIALSLYCILSQFSRPGVTADGQTYLQIARNIHLGAGLGWQATWVPPLHSILVALTGRLPGVPDLLLASALVGAVMGVVLVLGVWLLASEVFGRTVAFGAAVIAALFPHFLWIVRAPEAEITYTALLVLALWVFCVAFRRGSAVLAGLAGVCFSLAYLARSEGFLVMALVIAALLASRGRRLLHEQPLRLVAFMLIAFFITASPYLFFLKRHYGSFVISPKSTYVLIWMKSRIYHDNDRGEIGNEELWGLTPGGKLKWQVPTGASDLIRYLMSHPGKSARVYAENLGREIPGRIPNNSGMERYPQVFPVLLALAALLVPFRSWGECSRIKKAALLAPLAILLILPVFTEGWWKYLVPYAPIVIILGCAGIAGAAGMLQRFQPNAPRLCSLAVMLALAVGFRVKAFPVHLFPSKAGPQAAPQQSEEIKARASYAVEADKAGRWIAQKLGPGHNYMVQWSKLIYPLSGLWTAMPVADYPQLYAFARQQGAEFLVLELDGSPTEAQMAQAPPGLALALAYRSPESGYTVAVYRFVPLP